MGNCHRFETANNARSVALPNLLADPRQVGPTCLLLPSARLLSPSAGTAARQYPLGVATTPCAQPDWSWSSARRLYPAPLVLGFLGLARSFRWIGV